MSKLRRTLYRDASALGDLEAAAKGPGAYAKRRARRTVYRRSNGIVRQLLKALGL